MRAVGLDELNDLCRAITGTFTHLEPRDSYGTDAELPHLAAWRRGEPDDVLWLEWWLQLMRGHRAAGRTCQRARVVSEPLSDYQQWTTSHVDLFIEAGEDIRYVSRSRLATVAVPGSGDFYVFDDRLALFLHYAGNGTNASCELTDDRATVQACRQAFASVWALSTPYREHRPE